MQLDLVAEGITDVQIVGVSMIPFAEHDKSATLAGRVLPLVQDTPEVNAEGAWNALQRDVFILDDQGRLAVKLNLTTFDPDRSANNGENYELLKSLLLGARNRTDVSVSGNMLFQLFQDVAPRTTARFSELVNQGFYDGLMFHRVIDDFMAQGGDPAGNGTGGSGVEFDDEFDLRLTFTGFGQLAMANSGDDTNDSQFFITDLDLRATPFVEANLALPQHLNFDHTIFGQLIEGFDLFQEIMNTDVNGTRPVTPVVINNAMIVTDTQNALLRLSAPADFTGSSTITVTVTNPRSLTFERSFSVNVVADTVNDRPFLGPLSNIVTGVGTPAIFTVSATDLENDALTFVVRDPDNFSNPPPNVAVSIDQTTRQVTVTPGAGFTGLLNLLVGVRDDTRRVDSNGDGRIDASDALDARGNFDTQRVAFTVIQPVSNTRPSVAATSPQGTTIDKPLEFVVTASDPDADPATFAAEVVFERAGQSNAFQLQADDHMEGGITAQATLIEYLDFQ